MQRNNDDDYNFPFPLWHDTDQVCCANKGENLLQNPFKFAILLPRKYINIASNTQLEQ